MMRLTQTALLVAFLLITGCGSSASEYQGPTRFPVTGKVTLDGQAVDGGVIAFVPLAEGQKPAGGVITAGNYAVPEPQGAHAGQYRVEIRWSKPTGKKIMDTQDTGAEIDEVAEAVPERYNINSELTADVSETQTNFDFELRSE